MISQFFFDSLDAHARHMMRETQIVRVGQSFQALKLVVLTGVVYVWSLWDETDSVQLLIWMSLIFLTSVVRAFVCNNINEKVADSSDDELIANEKKLFLTSIISTTIIGSGFWWVCVEGTDRAAYSVAVLTCVYAIGTTINSSIQYRSFPFMLVSNLGQGCVFFMGVGGKPDLAVAVAMICLLLLLLRFGKQNAEIFSESIRMRDLNTEHNRQLEQDKMVIEKALNDAHEANQSKSRFLAAASHDLRQPLHALTLFLGTLRQTVDSRMPRYFPSPFVCVT